MGCRYLNVLPERENKKSNKSINVIKYAMICFNTRIHSNIYIFTSNEYLLASCIKSFEAIGQKGYNILFSGILC